MQNLLDLQKKKYEEALETIAHLKEALYYFMKFDPQNPEGTWRQVYELAFDRKDWWNDVHFDKNSFTPWKTFLRNWCKDTGPAFGTSIEMMEGLGEDREDG